MRFTVFAILLSACATSPDDGSSGGGGGGSGSGSGNSMGSGGQGSELPAELVGAWESSGGDGSLRYEFGAHGDVVYAGLLDASYDCTYTVTTSYQGVVTLQGNVLSIHPQEGTQVINQCGSVTTSSFTDPETDVYRVDTSQGAPILYLQDQATGILLTFTPA